MIVSRDTLRPEPLLIKYAHCFNVQPALQQAKPMLCVVHFYSPSNIWISVCKIGRCRITIPQITSSETES